MKDSIDIIRGLLSTIGMKTKFIKSSYMSRMHKEVYAIFMDLAESLQYSMSTTEMFTFNEK